VERFAPGQVVSDKFRVVSSLGEGAMGCVYVVEHLTLRTRLALKVLAPHLARRPEHVERFLREGAAISRVRHRAVVQVFDAGKHGEQPWLAMELLDGETLHDRMARGGLGAPEAVSIAVEILGGLAASHDQGIVHRDVKPANVFLARQPDGAVQPKLLDFGIALVVDAQERLTGAGMTMGTLHYMAPEQIHGARDVDARADLYAVAAILFEALSGRPPYPASSIHELVAAIATQPPPDLQRVAAHAPPALAPILNQCLATDRAQRPASARQLASMLEAAARAPSPAAAMPATMMMAGLEASRPGIDALAPTGAHPASATPPHGAWATPPPVAPPRQPTPPGGVWPPQPTPAPAQWPQSSSSPYPGAWQGHASAPAQHPGSWSGPSSAPPPSWPGASPSGWQRDPFAQPPPSPLRHLAWAVPLGLVAMVATGVAVAVVLDGDVLDGDVRDGDEPDERPASVAPAAISPPVQPLAAPAPMMMPIDPDAPVAPTPIPAVAPTPVSSSPALAPTPVAPRAGHACVGRWAGPLLQSDGQRGTGVVTIDSSSGRCGGFVERWSSGSVCHYSLSSCGTDGDALTARARAPSHEGCSPVRMRFTCGGGRMRFLESASGVTVSSLMSPAS
jgi:serine/threonine-protein kinase